VEDPKSWLPSRKKTLNTLWDKYRDLLFKNTILVGLKRRCSRLPSDFERTTKMALIYREDVKED
jgi:hypothetical protein